MNELDCITAEFNESVETGPGYITDTHLDEPAVLKYADGLMAGELNSEKDIRHVQECGTCKNKVLKYLNYYGFNELKIK